jgi:hypothetical protein
VAEHSPLDTEERAIHPLVRFSPHYYNTEAEIDRAVAAVAELASAGRRPLTDPPANPPRCLLQQATPGNADVSSVSHGTRRTR